MFIFLKEYKHSIFFMVVYMDMDPLIVKGLLVGIFIALPCGPVAFLCIKRAMVYGFRSGLCSGLGSLLADIALASVVIFGLEKASVVLVPLEWFMSIFGGVILIYLGWKMLQTKEKLEKIVVDRKTLIQHSATAALITLTNPIQLITFSFIFSAAHVGVISTTSQGLIFLGSLAFGSLLWWTVLCGVIDHFHEKYTERVIHVVSIIASCLLVFVGSFAVGTTLVRTILPLLGISFIH